MNIAPAPAEVAEMSNDEVLDLLKLQFHLVAETAATLARRNPANTPFRLSARVDDVEVRSVFSVEVA